MSKYQLEHFPAGARNDRFWCRMGPMFFDKEILKQLPYLREDSAKEWFLAFSDDRLVGFAAVELQKNGVAHIGSAWVDEQSRKAGIYKMLTDARIELAKERRAVRVRAICTEASAAQLKKRGFVETATRGRYVSMEKSL